MPTFVETSLLGKSWTQIMKVADTNGDKSWNHVVSVKVTDTNHESFRHKLSRHVKMFATESVTSLWQTSLCRCNGIWSVTMHGKSLRQVPDKVMDWTCHGLVADTNHESLRRDLCRGLSWFVFAILWGTCHGLCHKVGIMEFGLSWIKSVDPGNG